jgi:hypothetical protein
VGEELVIFRVSCKVEPGRASSSRRGGMAVMEIRSAAWVGEVRRGKRKRKREGKRNMVMRRGRVFFIVMVKR